MCETNDTTPGAQEHRDARLLELGAALDKAVDALWLAEEVLGDGSERVAGAIAQGWTLCDAIAERIGAHPAQTLDGLSVKARALALLGDEEDGVRRDLVRVLGRRVEAR
ncbi:MAG: hypothetical protein ACK4UM_11100 [Salinarimonas sp.]